MSEGLLTIAHIQLQALSSSTRVVLQINLVPTLFFLRKENFKPPYE